MCFRCSQRVCLRPVNWRIPEETTYPFSVFQQMRGTRRSVSIQRGSINRSVWGLSDIHCARRRTIRIARCSTRSMLCRYNIRAGHFLLWKTAESEYSVQVRICLKEGSEFKVLWRWLLYTGRRTIIKFPPFLSPFSSPKSIGNSNWSSSQGLSRR